MSIAQLLDAVGMRENGAVIFADAGRTRTSVSLPWLLSACGTYEQHFARFQLLLMPTAATVPQPSCPAEFLAEAGSQHEVGGCTSGGNAAPSGSAAQLFE